LLRERPEKEEELAKMHDEFLLSVPSLVKLAQDGSYHDRIESSYTQLKQMKLTLKLQLLKEAYLEEDELTEIKENLANLLEEYKQINFDSDQEDSDDGNDSGDEDY
jgi:hypothetical protein